MHGVAACTGWPHARVGRKPRFDCIKGNHLKTSVVNWRYMYQIRRKRGSVKEH